jgi:hypothetical protein
MLPNTEDEINLETKSVCSNASVISKKKEDDLISVISQLSNASKKSNRSQRPSSMGQRKANLESVGKSVVNDDKPKDDLIERLSNISRKVSEANKSFLEKISKKDDDLQSIRSIHSQILKSSHMGTHKEKKDENATKKEKKVFTLRDIKK